MKLTSMLLAMAFLGTSFANELDGKRAQAVIVEVQNSSGSVNLYKADKKLNETLATQEDLQAMVKNYVQETNKLNSVVFVNRDHATELDEETSTGAWYFYYYQNYNNWNNLNLYRYNYFTYYNNSYYYRYNLVRNPAYTYYFYWY